jgi:hypothetical protein
LIKNERNGFFLLFTSSDDLSLTTYHFKCHKNKFLLPNRTRLLPDSLSYKLFTINFTYFFFGWKSICILVYSNCSYILLLEGIAVDFNFFYNSRIHVFKANWKPVYMKKIYCGGYLFHIIISQKTKKRRRLFMKRKHESIIVLC